LVVIANAEEKFASLYTAITGADVLSPSYTVTVLPLGTLKPSGNVSET
jgi:hypothetical protein